MTTHMNLQLKWSIIATIVAIVCISNTNGITTPSPNVVDEPCDDDRKAWNISVSCPSIPRFELVSTCPGEYALQVRLDKIFQVHPDMHLNFTWDGGNDGEPDTLNTVDGEERTVKINRFSARINNPMNETNAWLNITVLFFIDPRGGVFDLLGTGNPIDYSTVESNTLKYLIDASNWPFKRESDLLAIRFAYELKEI
eukprot:1014299_1